MLWQFLDFIASKFSILSEFFLKPTVLIEEKSTECERFSFKFFNNGCKLLRNYAINLERPFQSLDVTCATICLLCLVIIVYCTYSVHQKCQKVPNKSFTPSIPITFNIFTYYSSSCKAALISQMK